jgi:hypothetical protein
MVSAVIRTMQNAADERRSRRSTGRKLAFAAGIAAVFLLALATWRAGAIGGAAVARFQSLPGDTYAGRNHGAVVASRSSPAEVRPAGSAGSDVGLRLPSGVGLVMKPETRFKVPDLQTPSNREELLLELGFVRAEVPKLPAGHVFAVRTPDALVTVHGTSFSVEVAKAGPSAAPTTTVIVTQGVVSVEHEDREALVYAGMEWTSSGGNLSSALAPAESRTAAVAKPRLVPPAPEPIPGGTGLSEQNALFAQAKLAGKRGDQTRAVRILEDFVRRYPSSLLAQDAQVEMFRSLAQMGDRAGAAREAQRYLTLYPDGFARDEASDLALPSNKTSE